MLEQIHPSFFADALRVFLTQRRELDSRTLDILSVLVSKAIVQGCQSALLLFLNIHKDGNEYALVSRVVVQ